MTPRITLNHIAILIILFLSSADLSISQTKLTSDEIAHFEKIKNKREIGKVELKKSASILLKSPRISEPEKAEVFSALSFALAYSGEIDSAYIFCKEAIEISKNLDDKSLYQQSLTHFGIINSKLNNYPETLNSFRVVAEIAKERGEIIKEAGAYTNLALTYEQMGDYERSIEMNFQAIKVFKEMKSYHGIGIVLSGIGNIYHILGENEKALEYFKKAIDNFKLNKDFREIIGSHINIATVLLAMDRGKESIIHCDYALNYMHEHNDKVFLPDIYNTLGKTFFSLGMPDSARYYLDKSQKLYSENKNYEELIDVYLMYSELDLNSNNQENYFTNLLKAQKYAEQINSIENLSRTTLQLADYYKSVKNYSMAYKYLSDHHYYTDSLLNINKQSKIEELNAKYEIGQKDAKIRELVIQEQRSYIIYLILTAIVLALAILIFFIRYSFQKRNIILLKETEREAIKSDRLKSEFLAQISHEIRTPVNSMVSFASLIQDELNDSRNPDLETALDSINSSGSRLMRTIDMILNMSLIQTGTYKSNIETFDLYNAILKDSIHEFELSANNQGLNFNVSFNTKDFYVTGDQSSIVQIFNNLYDNALKYTSEGEISTLIEKSGNDLKVTISDTGMGIDQSYLKNIFKPFTQETQGYTRKFDGNGLGLSLVKSYCDFNDINITINSVKNEGTSVSLFFTQNS